MPGVSRNCSSYVTSTYTTDPPVEPLKGKRVSQVDPITDAVPTRGATSTSMTSNTLPHLMLNAQQHNNISTNSEKHLIYIKISYWSLYLLSGALCIHLMYNNVYFNTPSMRLLMLTCIMSIISATVGVVNVVKGVCTNLGERSLFFLRVGNVNMVGCCAYI